MPKVRLTPLPSGPLRSISRPQKNIWMLLIAAVHPVTAPTACDKSFIGQVCWYL